MHAILSKNIEKVIDAIHRAGGRPFVVGGAVRDVLLGMTVASKDLDFEVYDISMETLMKVLSKFGKVDAVGRSFGVIKLWMRHEGEIDFSLPRRESKVGAGHRGFIAEPDPSMSPEEACARRDFTLNAILMEPVSGELMDFFNGKKDLENNVLRHTSAHFSEDPLRPLRAVQLSARFGFHVHPDTAKLCADMVREADALAEERIFGEWEKWALRSQMPSRGLSTLAEIGWLPLFPELEPLMQDEEMRRRLMSRTDRASRIAREENLDSNDTLVLLTAALCREMDETSTQSFLDRLGMSPKLLKRAALLVREARAYEETKFEKDEDILRAAVRLKPESLTMLSRLTASSPGGEEASSMLLSKAAALGVETHPPVPLLQGRDLSALGISPGPFMGKILKAAFEAQLSCAFASKEEALLWATSKKYEH
jgi:tRNA nucleotidyltransferase (CCA-adding enzyme)